MSIELKSFQGEVEGVRLVNAKFPSIAIFEDVASTEEFDAIYEVLALTNPTIKAESGELALLPKHEIPSAIDGCSHALAPFTHINPEGSRFSDGSFGLLYVADREAVALAELRHRQQVLWSNVPELHFDRLVFRAINLVFPVEQGLDACHFSMTNDMYDSSDYSASRSIGTKLKNEGTVDALRYHSVRHADGIRYALFTPRIVSSITMASHYEMVWNGTVMNVSCLTSIG